jgi:hypothetical protein
MPILTLTYPGPTHFPRASTFYQPLNGTVRSSDGPSPTNSDGSVKTPPPVLRVPNFPSFSANVVVPQALTPTNVL